MKPEQLSDKRVPVESEFFALARAIARGLAREHHEAEQRQCAEVEIDARNRGSRLP
jgi:hypothetical protein